MLKIDVGEKLREVAQIDIFDRDVAKRLTRKCLPDEVL